MSHTAWLIRLKYFLDNAIKLKSSSIVAALLTEEEKIMIFEKVAKMFLGRFEEFEKMTSSERDEALQDAARNMAHEEQQIAEGTYRPFDNMDLRIDFNKKNWVAKQSTSMMVTADAG